MSSVTEAGQRLELFLADEAVQTAFEVMKKEYYRAFVGAKTDDDRRMAQAKALVLDTFETALRATVDGAEREILEQEKRDRAPATR